MKALSVRQPWAWAIIHGGKDIENRSRMMSHRGALAIHATKPASRDDYDLDCDEIEQISGKRPPALERAAVGAVIGTVDVVGCIDSAGDDEPQTTSPWAQYGLCWIMVRNAKALASPIPAKGRLGLFELADDAIA